MLLNDKAGGDGGDGGGDYYLKMHENSCSKWSAFCLRI